MMMKKLVTGTNLIIFLDYTPFSHTRYWNKKEGKKNSHSLNELIDVMDFLYGVGTESKEQEK